MLNDTFNCFIRNDGNPKLSMAAMLTGSFSNIILDYVFIFPLDMGIFGAILATGLSISLCILSIYKFRKRTASISSGQGTKEELLLRVAYN